MQLVLDSAQNVKPCMVHTHLSDHTGWHQRVVALIYGLGREGGSEGGGEREGGERKGRREGGERKGGREGGGEREERGRERGERGRRAGVMMMVKSWGEFSSIFHTFCDRPLKSPIKMIQRERCN